MEVWRQEQLASSTLMEGLLETHFFCPLGRSTLIKEPPRAQFMKESETLLSALGAISSLKEAVRNQEQAAKGPLMCGQLTCCSIVD
jgi:hypothetical protein